MSTAVSSQGMNTYNNTSNQGGYVSWKGSGSQSNPVGVTSTNIRPLTNKDMGNVFPTGFGLPRPIKHYRKGRVIPTHYENPSQSPTENYDINYNLNRAVRSSVGASLGGGAGGTTLVSQLIGQPGGFSVKANVPHEINEIQQAMEDCKTCNGIFMVSDFYPNKSYLTQNPEPVTQMPGFCCNEERKARRRVVYANTNLKKNYFTTMQQYRENRCQTFDQRAFNFQTNVPTGFNAKPGSPLALGNLYVGNCQPNGEIEATNIIAFIDNLVEIMRERNIMTSYYVNLFIRSNITTLKDFLQFLNVLPAANRQQAMSIYNEYSMNPYNDISFGGTKNCKKVIYKPNNYQYATQGAVSSSTRTFKQNVTTIETNLAGYNRAQRQGPYLGARMQSTDPDPSSKPSKLHKYAGLPHTAGYP